jgi:hypothetical protein
MTLRRALAVCFVVLSLGSCATSQGSSANPPHRTLGDILKGKWDDLWKGRYMIGGKVIPPIYTTQSDISGRVNGMDVTLHTDTVTINRIMKQMGDAIAEGSLVVVMPERKMEFHIFEVGTLDRMEAAYLNTAGQPADVRAKAVDASMRSKANACGDWCEPIAAQFVAQHP